MSNNESFGNDGIKRILRNVLGWIENTFSSKCNKASKVENLVLRNE